MRFNIISWFVSNLSVLIWCSLAPNQVIVFNVWKHLYLYISFFYPKRSKAASPPPRQERKWGNHQSSVWEFDLEASWGGSGGSRGPSGEPRWIQVGSQEGGFWGPETKRKWLHYWEPLVVDIFMICWWILVDIWKAKWSQVGIKLEFNKERTWKRVFLTNLRFP